LERISVSKELKRIIIPCDFDKTIFGTLTCIGPKGDQFKLLSSYDNVEGSFVYKHDLSYSANGTTITVKDSTASVGYTIAKASTKEKSVTIPDTVTVDGKKYEVTEVSAEALKNSSATTVTIGKNVTTLAPEAFKGSNVKTITIKSKKLTKKSVKNAFKGLKVKKLIVKVKVGSKKENKKYIKKYKKFFTKKNIGVKAVVK